MTIFSQNPEKYIVCSDVLHKSSKPLESTVHLFKWTSVSKLYISSTVNIDLILWHTQLIVCAENVKSWFKSWDFPFTFQAYILPHTLDCLCVSLFKFHI